MARPLNPGELRHHVRVERMTLQQEQLALSRRLRAIDERLAELDKADDLLAGM